MSSISRRESRSRSFRRIGPSPAEQVLFAELLGSRQAKYEALRLGAIACQALNLAEPQVFFTPKDLSLSDEYSSYASLSDVFRAPSYGIQTKRDALTIGPDPTEVMRRAALVLNSEDAAVRDAFSLPADGRDWTIKWARSDLARLEEIGGHVRRVLYRPFDWRWTIYTDRSKGFLAYPRWDSMKCMLTNNIGLIAMRQVFQDVDFYSHIGVTDTLIDERTFYSNRGGTYLFPLYSANEDRNLASSPDVRCHNFRGSFLERLAATIGGESGSALDAPTVFAYVYAVLASLSYRVRYKPLLKIDFPRVPLPGSFDLFGDLAQLGQELIDTQLMKPVPTGPTPALYSGPTCPVVERIGWSDDTIWLDAQSKRKGGVSAGSIGFRPVSERVWRFELGGYQVCYKWLKDRKGQTLSADDIGQYERIVVAISDTIRLIAEIDEVIEVHGDWPDAFVTSGGQDD